MGSKIFFLALCLAVSGCAHKDSLRGTGAAGPVEGVWDAAIRNICDNNDKIPGGKIAVYAFTDISGSASPSGKLFAERLTTELARSGKLTIIERTRVDAALKELNFSASGVVDERMAARLGQMIGAGAVVTGTIADTGSNKLEANIRLIDTATGIIITGSIVRLDREYPEATDRTPPSGQAAPVTVAVPAPLISLENRTGYPGKVRGLQAYWKFEEDGSGAAKDSSGKGNDAQLHGPSRATAGKGASALEFGNSDYLHFHAPAAFNAAQAVTVMVWVNYRAINFSETGIRLFSNTAGYNLAIGGESKWKATLSANVSGGHSYDGSSILSPDKWYHAGFTFDGAKIVIYLNGTPDGVFNVAGRLAAGPSDVYIGRDPTAVGGYHMPLDGYLDEVAVYNRALSAGEMAAVYGSYSADPGHGFLVRRTVENTGN